jgi:ABC-2 type transport system permease protein
MSTASTDTVVAGRGPHRSAVVARHTAILLARDPATVLAYTVMAAVLLTVLRPVYERLGATGAGPSIDTEAPGTAVMFTLLALDVAGQNLLSERTWHTWDRLRAGSSGPLNVLLGKAIPLTALFALQQSALFVFADAVYGFDIGAGSWRLPVMVAAWSGCVTAIGLAVGSWVRSQGQLSAAADVGALAVTCLSGSLVPLAILPHWVARVAPWTPGYWALHGFQAAVEGERAVFLRALAVVAGISVLSFVVAVRGARRVSHRAP